PTRKARKRGSGFGAQLLSLLAQAGQLVGARTRRMSARVGPGLLKAGNGKTRPKERLHVVSTRRLQSSQPRTISVRGLPRKRVGGRRISRLVFDFETHPQSLRAFKMDAEPRVSTQHRSPLVAAAVH